VAQERQAAEHFLLLDTGDALIGGGILGDQTQGAAVVAGMNLMGYDAMALGPKELSLGLDTLQQRVDEAQFPILSANAVLEGGQALIVPAQTIVEAGPYRLGILGLTCPPEEPLPGIQVLNPIETAARTVPQLAAEADVVILLTNLPYASAMTLASQVPGIDLVVAALPAQLPTQAVRIPQTGALIVTAEQPLPKHTGRQMGRLSVQIESDGSLSNEAWTVIPMSALFADDLEMQALLQEYQR
jgi:5'-nucleotidase